MESSREKIRQSVKSGTLAGVASIITGRGDKSRSLPFEKGGLKERKTF